MVKPNRVTGSSQANSWQIRAADFLPARFKWAAGGSPFPSARKELGALLASQDGIFAAQRVLRHAQISTTASYYTDKKRRITAGLGALLTAPEAIPFPAPAAAAKRPAGKPAPGLKTKRTAAQ